MRRLRRRRGRSALAEAEKRGGKYPPKGSMATTAVLIVVLPVQCEILRIQYENARQTTPKSAMTPEALQKQRHRNTKFLRHNGQDLEDMVGTARGSAATVTVTVTAARAIMVCVPAAAAQHL